MADAVPVSAKTFIVTVRVPAVGAPPQTCPTGVPPSAGLSFQTSFRLSATLPAVPAFSTARSTRLAPPVPKRGARG